MKKLFTLAAAMLVCAGVWAAETVNVGTYSTQTISEDFLTSTWAFAKPSSTANIPIGTKENDVLYQASSLGKIKVGGSNLSWSGTSSAYIYVPDGAAGTITLVPSSSSDSRYLQLFVDGENAGESKRLWSKFSETPTSDGKKGPQSFTFTSADLTTVGDSTFLHFKDNNTEMKIASISIVLTSGSYANCTDPEAVLTLSKTSMFVNEQAHLEFTTKGTSEDWGIYVFKDGKEAKYGEDYSLSSYPAMYPVSIDVTPLTAGTFELTAFQESDGTYCAVDEKVTVTVNAANPVTAVTIDGPTAAYVGYKLTYTATVANATAYEWYLDDVKQGSDSAKFIYTAVKGNHSIVCKARNDFNAEKEWIASDPIALTVTSLYGQLIAATAETDPSNNIDKNITATGIVGGTVHQKSQKNAKLGSSGHYFSLTLAAGSFNAGDTVKVVVTPEYSDKNKTYSAPAQLKISTAVDNSNLIGESDTKTIDPASSADLYFDIVLTEGASTIYLARDGSICKQNPIVKSIAVIRPMPIKSTVVALANVKINDVAVAAADLTKLLADGSLAIEDDYLNAPVVKFFQETTITYEDDSKKVITDSVAVTASEVAGKWQAKTTVNKVEYTVTMAKTASYEVTYKLGTRTLGTELVAANGNPANYATYQDLKDGGLSIFGAWFSKSDLSGDAVTIASAVITKDTAFYASFTYKYAQSINIEQSIIANGKDSAASVALINSLGTLNYAKNILYKKGTNELDSLNDGKGAMRNYDYLGLKIKTAGAMLNLRLAEGKTVNIKFGNVAATPLVAINGGDYAEMSLTNGVYTYTATGEDLVSIKTATAGAVVFKQIAINEPLADVMYPITYAETENGTIAGWKIALPGETVNLTATPAENYQLKEITVNAEKLEPVENKYSFTMPAKAVEVAATFETEPTAIGNTEAEVKAVKVIRNGQLIIIRDGKEFNVLGSQTK